MNAHTLAPPTDARCPGSECSCPYIDVWHVKPNKDDRQGICVMPSYTKASQHKLTIGDTTCATLQVTGPCRPRRRNRSTSFFKWLPVNCPSPCSNYLHRSIAIALQGPHGTFVPVIAVSRSTMPDSSTQTAMIAAAAS